MLAQGGGHGPSSQGDRRAAEPADYARKLQDEPGLDEFNAVAAWLLRAPMASLAHRRRHPDLPRK